MDPHRPDPKILFFSFHIGNTPSRTPGYSHEFVLLLPWLHVEAQLFSCPSFIPAYMFSSYPPDHCLWPSLPPLGSPMQELADTITGRKIPLLVDAHDS